MVPPHAASIRAAAWTSSSRTLISLNQSTGYDEALKVGATIMKGVVACYLFALFVGGFYFTYRLRKRLNDMSANKKRDSTNGKLAKKVKDLTCFMALETFILFCTAVVSSTNTLLRQLNLVSNETTPDAALAIKARVGGARPRAAVCHVIPTPLRSAPAAPSINCSNTASAVGIGLVTAHSSPHDTQSTLTKLT